jgi:hypothetical protein
MTRSIDWHPVTTTDVEWAVGEFERRGADDFYAWSGFRPTLAYDLHVAGRTYPAKAILGVAYEHATGERLEPSDFEGGRAGAVTVLGRLGFDVRPRR